MHTRPETKIFIQLWLKKEIFVLSIYRLAAQL